MIGLFASPHIFCVADKDSLVQTEPYREQPRKAFLPATRWRRLQGRREQDQVLGFAQDCGRVRQLHCRRAAQADVRTPWHGEGTSSCRSLTRPPTLHRSPEASSRRYRRQRSGGSSVSCSRCAPCLSEANVAVTSFLHHGRITSPLAVSS